ncbi:hypothetical protein PHYBOEH_008591 [Phytophthora boehmeriae]|uniref:Uncharacterized protein n=1 Tax=Phytophthora boehmeriae TaxID=109152 RepID=A0A8T1W2L5_9STRA|nr:hypothetical protein PHYBOEH_008591 [Phytophthora boehmeriae]
MRQHLPGQDQLQRARLCLLHLLQLQETRLDLSVQHQLQGQLLRLPGRHQVQNQCFRHQSADLDSSALQFSVAPPRQDPHRKFLLVRGSERVLLAVWALASQLDVFPSVLAYAFLSVLVYVSRSERA